mmetsp:Transcript_22284/g.40501  ORF Transcript_22284/g.40501 Transcript_22284/m.40501 type:complete len:130 (-) Transcript_22284:192-581(-)
MGNIQCALCAKERPKDTGPAVGTYVWEDGFHLQNEPSSKEWRKCKTLIQEALPIAEAFVREELSSEPADDAKSAADLAAKLCNDWLIGLNLQLQRAGFMLDACGWTQYESNGQGGANARPKLALLIKLL